jgi:hypothetical protein
VPCAEAREPSGGSNPGAPAVGGAASRRGRVQRPSSTLVASGRSDGPSTEDRAIMASVRSVAVIMSPNKHLVESYFASTGTEYGRLLAEDVELVEWADGVPASGVRTQGKAAFLANRGNREYETRVTRLTEEDNVVVAEGTAHGPKKEGGFWTVHFCNIFELENGKVKRLTAMGASVKDPA